MNPSPKKHLLITGGCGKIGSHFARFAAGRYILRLVDKIPWDTGRLGPPVGETLVYDLHDPACCRQAFQGMDVVLHLAADASPEADFETSLLPNNLLASYHLFRAAREAGCQRFIFASSAHAVSAYPPDIQINNSMPVRPANLYGVSKCFGEALAAYFAFSEGLPSVAVRIGAYALPEEYDRFPREEMDAFLAAEDLNELLVRCLETPGITFAIAHAISDNRFKRLDLSETRQLFGYQPRLDAFELFGTPGRGEKVPPAD